MVIGVWGVLGLLHSPRSPAPADRIVIVASEANKRLECRSVESGMPKRPRGSTGESLLVVDKLVLLFIISPINITIDILNLLFHPFVTTWGVWKIEKRFAQTPLKN